MPSPLASFNDAVKSEPTLLQRCLSALQIVASVWLVLGVGINFFTLGNPSIKWHIFGIGCILIAAAMYSVLLPLYYITRAHRADPNA